MRSIPDEFPSWLLLGAALGWQAVVGVFALLVVWRLLCAVMEIFFVQTESAEGSSPVPWLLLPGTMFVHHCIWRPIIELVSRT